MYQGPDTYILSQKHQQTYCFVLFIVCPKCGVGKAGLTCCGKGGSWHRNCGSGAEKFEHTWNEGIEACSQKVAAGKKINMTQVVTHEKEDRSPRLTQNVVYTSANTVIAISSTIVVMMVFMHTLIPLTTWD